MSEINVPSYLPEHAAPDNPNYGTPGYNPSPDDKKILQMVDSLYSRAKKYRKRYDQRWIDFYKMFRGRQWKEVRPAYRSSEVINLVFEAIQSQVPILTDSRPKLEFLPTVATQYELADILTKVAANDWEHNNWLMVLTEIIYDAHFYGTGFGYVGFDRDAEMGLGCVDFESEDCFFVFPDPDARDINGKRTKFFIVAKPEDITKLKKEYRNNPDSQFIAADVIDFQQGDKADIYQVMFKSPTDSKLIVEGPSGYDTIAKNQALKVTVFSKDDDFEELAQTELHEDGTPKLDENGNEVQKFVQVKKYPTGRKTVCAGGVVLEDGPQEFEDGQFPYVKFNNYMLPREFWGMGEVEQLDGPQKSFNKILSFAMDVMGLMGNPIWIVDDSSGVDTENLFNKPGLVVEKTAGTEVRRESGVDLQPFVLALADRYRTYVNGVSGATDLSKGIEPTNVTAAAAIQDLQQAQQTRLRLKSRYLDAFLNDFGKLYLSRIFQYYSVPRIVRVSGDNKAENYFYFHVEKLETDEKDPQGNTVYKRVAHIMDHRGQAKAIEIMGDFDVKVSTGSSLEFAKQARNDEVMKLFQLGVIDDEELLKSMDYPNYESVLQRQHQKKQAMQQAQMQMAAQMQQAKVAETQSKAQKNVVDAAATAKDSGLGGLTPAST